MNYLYWILGSVLAAVWFSRILDAALGMPKVADISQPQFDRPGTASPAPRVSIIVPARNEDADIEQTLSRLLELEYDNYEVIAVNDRSTDRTGEVMERVAASPRAEGRLQVIHVDALPTRWLGKTHAMWTGSCRATGDWLLFTDADVRFKPDALRRAIAYGLGEPADHVVLLPAMIMTSPGERMMIAFFQTLFVFGHRPWKVADPRTKDHMGVGAFNLVRRPVYEAIGTYERLRMEVIDDMKLGKVIKTAGFRQRNVFGGDLISLRWARGAMGVVDNLTKNFFATLFYRWPLAIISVFLLAFLNLMPFAGVFLSHGWARLPFSLALFFMFCIYVGMSWRSSIPPYYFLLHPVSTVLFCYTILRSTFLTLIQGGVRWRGTFYPLDELRRGMV